MAAAWIQKQAGRHQGTALTDRAKSHPGRDRPTASAAPSGMPAPAHPWTAPWHTVGHRVAGLPSRCPGPTARPPPGNEGLEPVMLPHPLSRTTGETLSLGHGQLCGSHSLLQWGMRGLPGWPCSPGLPDSFLAAAPRPMSGCGSSQAGLCLLVPVLTWRTCVCQVLALLAWTPETQAPAPSVHSV